MTSTFTEAPVSLHRVPRPPAFPLSALGGELGDFVTAVAEATQTDPAMAGGLALGALAAAAGGRAEVEVRPGWREPTNLYVVVASAPGTRKSGVFREVLGPLRAAERSLADAARPAILQDQTAKTVAQLAAEAATRKAGGSSSETRDAAIADAIAAQEMADAITVPSVPRLLADDVTPEALASLLAENGGRLAVVSAEGGLFDVLGGRYSKGVNLDAVLKGHAGDTLRVDRKGRPPEYIEHPALTMALTVQPSVLEAIGRNGDFSGRGLLARFMYVLPLNTVGHRRIAAPPVPDDLRDRYAARMQALAEGLAGWEDPAVLQLTPEAGALHLAAERALEKQLRPAGDLGGIVEWASKLMGAIARIAGLLHLAHYGANDGVRRPIDGPTMQAALDLGSYFTGHARKAFDQMGADHSLDDARAVLRHVHSRDLDSITVRDLFTALPRARFSTVDIVVDALDVLEEYGWAKRKPEPERPGPGRKPSPTWLICSETIAAELAVSAERESEEGSADTADNAAMVSGTASVGPQAVDNPPPAPASRHLGVVPSSSVKSGCEECGDTAGHHAGCPRRSAS